MCTIVLYVDKKCKYALIVCAQLLCQNIMGLISSPLRIIVAMVMLYFELGFASLVALGVLLLLMPTQARACQALPMLSHPLHMLVSFWLSHSGQTFPAFSGSRVWHVTGIGRGGQPQCRY